MKTKQQTQLKQRQLKQRLNTLNRKIELLVKQRNETAVELGMSLVQYGNTIQRKVYAPYKGKRLNVGGLNTPLW